MLDAQRFRLLGGLARAALRTLYGLGLEGSRLDPLRRWTKERVAPAIPRKSFRALWREGNGAS